MWSFAACGDVELEGGGQLEKAGLGEGGEGVALVHSRTDLPRPRQRRRRAGSGAAADRGKSLP